MQETWISTLCTVSPKFSPEKLLITALGLRFEEFSDAIVFKNFIVVFFEFLPDVLENLEAGWLCKFSCKLW